MTRGRRGMDSGMTGNKVIKREERKKKSPFRGNPLFPYCILTALHLIIVILSSCSFATVDCQMNSSSSSTSPLFSTPSFSKRLDEDSKKKKEQEGLRENVLAGLEKEEESKKVTDDEVSKKSKKEYEERLMDQLMRETLLKLKHIEEKKYPLQAVVSPVVLFPSIFSSSPTSSRIPSTSSSSSDFFSISERVTALKNVFDSILSIEKDLTWNPVVPSRMSRGFFLVKLFSNLLKIMPFQEVSIFKL